MQRFLRESALSAQAMKKPGDGSRDALTGNRMNVVATRDVFVRVVAPHVLMNKRTGFKEASTCILEDWRWALAANLLADTFSGIPQCEGTLWKERVHQASSAYRHRSATTLTKTLPCSWSFNCSKAIRESLRIRTLPRKAGSTETDE